MRRARKPQRTRRKPAPASLPDNVVRTLELIALRLARVNGLLNAIDCIERRDVGDVGLSPLAVAARDLVDRVLDDLAPFRPWPAKDVRP